jgi:ABC-2 type transport system permease protein
MAVYKRGYEPYAGPLTPEWSRFLIVARYAHRRVLSSRSLVAFFVISAIYPLVCAALIYLPYNATAAELFRHITLFPIDGRFFFRFLQWQAGMLAFLLTGFLGPGLVSPDLANNALPLYFSRPFSRAEYVLGKMAVLAILLSWITWVPGLLLFGFKAYLAGFGWAVDNWYLASGLFIGSWAWIVTLCFFALATSAWVKWRMVAGALIFGLVFVGAGFGEALNRALHTTLGCAVNLPTIIRTVWSSLFRSGTGSNQPLLPSAAWTLLAAFCAVCYLLLAGKLRAYHVERS